jgi:hypothetical protein
MEERTRSHPKNGKLELLTDKNSTLVLVDYQRNEITIPEISALNVEMIVPKT